MFLPLRGADVQREHRGHREGAPELLGQLRIESGRADEVAVVEREVDFVDEERTARQVERHLDERFVERHEVGREPTHAGLVAERFLDALAERDADVFDGVVRVDVRGRPRTRS